MTLRKAFSVRSVKPSQLIAVAVLTLLVCASAVGTLVASESSSPNCALAVWAAEKGLPPGDVFALAQDLDGYLWLGTPTGLLRFDGSRFTPWIGADPADALPSGPVHAIVGSPDGSLWVGFGGGGGVVRIYRGKVVRHSPADGAPPGVTAMIQDRQGAIWVAVRRGL